MIIDAFTFFNELDMLEFRLRLLYPYVDRFVIVEADTTHSGKPKPFYFDANRFAWAMRKIVLVQMKFAAGDMGPRPTSYNPLHASWQIENTQREGILNACTGFSGNDAIVISDVDEIPSLSSLPRPGRYDLPAMACTQHLFYYNLTNVFDDPWFGSVISSLGHAREVGAQTLRNNRNALPKIAHGGWHLSYFGGAEKIAHKIDSFAHQEFNTDESKDRDRIQKCIASGESLHDRGRFARTVGAEFFPEYFVNAAKPYGWGL